MRDMQMKGLTGLVFSLLILGSSANAQQWDEALSGFIIDKTATPRGYDFYTTFSRIWNPPHGPESYNLIIAERRGLRSSKVMVLIDDRVVFAALLDKNNSINTKARQAIKKARRYVVQYIGRELAQDPDLDPNGY